MAESEDTMPTSGLKGEDMDLSDETQDFRFLAAISGVSSSEPVIPRRGEKDFEPHSTALQSSALATSRQAMHTALSFERTHQPKTATVGTYHAQTNMVFVDNAKGAIFQKMGRVLKAKGNEDDLLDDGVDAKVRGQRLWLLPEEVLWLLERGTLDVRWPRGAEDGDDCGGDGMGLAMSLQGAYAVFLAGEEIDGGTEKGLTLERYAVYANLKRNGYIVMRAPSWDSEGPNLGEECFPPRTASVQTWRTGLLSSAAIWKLFSSPERPIDPELQASGPLVDDSLYRNYETIYRRLALVSSYDPSSISYHPTSPQTDPDFRLTYHVWKPNSTTFKKSQPGIPDFRIAVIDARQTSMPTLDQLSALMDTVPYNPPKTDAQMFAKLKNGYKNVILAVVDNGVTSYLRLADAAFGQYKVYERSVASFRGGKRGGRGGGRGRGRGRGR